MSRVALGCLGLHKARCRLARREDPPVEDGGRVDEEHYPNGVDYLPRGRYGCGAVLRQPIVSANGKPLHGAAKMSFVKKCKRDACASKAVSAEGKPLHGAAKNGFMRKCMTTA